MKLTKVASGLYETTFHGIKFTVTRNTERDTPWFGQWAITYGFHGGSDPIKTLRECKQALVYMERHPEQFWPGRFKTYTCAHCTTPFIQDSRIVMDDGANLWCDACSALEDEALSLTSAQRKAIRLLAKGWTLQDDGFSYIRWAILRSTIRALRRRGLVANRSLPGSNLKWFWEYARLTAKGEQLSQFLER